MYEYYSTLYGLYIYAVLVQVYSQRAFFNTVQSMYSISTHVLVLYKCILYTVHTGLVSSVYGLRYIL